MSDFLKGRYFGEQDISFINGINDELLNDIIQNVVTIYKMCSDATETNIYGEKRSSVIMSYYPGIDVVCLVDRGEISTTPDDFGPDRKQTVVFKFLEKDLEAINFFPGTGDLIMFNSRFHQIDDISQEQLLGNQPDKSFSIIVNTHYSRLSANDIVIRTN